MAVEIVGAHSEKPIQLDSEEVNEVMTVSEGENPISASQLQSMFATFMAAMRAENCKLASTLESKLNELQKETNKQTINLEAKITKTMKSELNNLSEKFEAKLAAVSESLDAKINSVSDTLNTNGNLMIQKLTSDMTDEHDKIRKEFSHKLETEIQLVTNQVEVVKKTTDVELDNLVRSVEGVCEGINESMNAHKSQTDAKVKSIRAEVDQNKDEFDSKVGEIKAEITSVASSLAEYSNRMQTDKEVYEAEIQKLKTQVQNIDERLNSNKAQRTTPQVCSSPQASVIARLTEVSQPSSQVSSAGSESGRHISPSVNGVSGCNVSRCNEVNNTSNIDISCADNVNAPSESVVNASQYSELALPKFCDSSKQVAVHFIRELDEYFSLRKTPEELRLPLVFRSISDPFAKQWMSTTYGQLKSYDEFKKAFIELLWDGTRQSEIRCRVYQDRYDYRSGESFSEHYIRYANMASMLSPAMSDQDLLSAMITHYEPRVQSCLISANLKSTQEALAVLTKLQSLENSREHYRSTRRECDRQDQNWRTPRDQPNNSTGNRGPNRSVQVRHIRRDGRDGNARGYSSGNPQMSEGPRSFYGGQGRPDDRTERRLNAAAQDFMPRGTQLRESSRSPNRRDDRPCTSNLNA